MFLLPSACHLSYLLFPSRSWSSSWVFQFQNPHLRFYLQSFLKNCTCHFIRLFNNLFSTVISSNFNFFNFLWSLSWLFLLQVKLCMCFIKHNVVNMYRRVEVWHHTFLNSTLKEGEQIASCPEERAPCIQWIGGCVGPRADLHVVEEKHFAPT
jgi:hypothetical protein